MRLLLVAAMLAGTTGAANAAQPAVANKRPNILFIISDDIGVDASSTMYPGSRTWCGNMARRG